jgi:thymidylate synthase
MVSAWNVGELDQMTLPPCHYGFQVYTRELSEQERFEKWWIEYFNTPVDYIHSTYAMDIWEKEHSKSYPTRAISLMWNQRSVDTFLGLPFNIASYGLLLEIIAKTVNMVPDELIGNLGDVHLYEDHTSQAREQITREPYQLPKLHVNDEFWATENDVKHHNIDVLINSMLIEDFQIEGYQSHPAIKAPLST